MKVIAIKDSPLLPGGFSFRGKTIDRAYTKGDIFIVSDRDRGQHTQEEILIEHPIFGVMACRRSSFMSLEEFRQIKLEQLEI